MAGELTAAEAAAAAEVPVEQARRIWRSFGFPDRGDERAYADADVLALTTVRELVDGAGEGFDVALNVARGIGITLGRLAEWEVGALLQNTELTPESAERFEGLLRYAWRRHLSAALDRAEAAKAIEDEPGTTTLTVGFADIVGFTSLSNEVTRERIGDIVETFESRCGDVIGSLRGRMIKSIGDAVLFVNDDAMAAFETAEGIINIIGRDQRMPDVRVGLATGSVVMRMGDVFGPPVNMASRLTQVARRNRIIVDRGTADLLPEDLVESRPLPPRPVRGFGVVEPVAVRRP
ncbi:adenylate/guanylate cyclase domain-containing protein [Nocardioides montaniterrae]